MADRIDQTAPLNAAQAEQRRTLTYPLVGGGSLEAACPSWCTADHAADQRSGIDPSELLHEGEQVSTTFELYGGEHLELLEARITQEPYSDTAAARRPHVAFRPQPDAELGADQYMTADGLNRVIAQLTAYTLELTRLRDQLGQARAEAHAERHDWLDARQPCHLSRTADLRPEDARTLPLDYLIAVFGAELVDAPGGGMQALATGSPGSMQIHLDPILTPPLREAAIRHLLAQQLGASA